MRAWFVWLAWRFRAWLTVELLTDQIEMHRVNVQAINALAARVQELATQIQASHVAQKPFAAPSLDSWEAAQLEAMWRLQQDPDKEH